MSTFVKIGGLLERMPAFLLIRAWKETAGPALLKHTQFLGVFENGPGQWQLRIQVFDKIWHQELEFQKDEILKRYTEVLAGLNYPKDRFPNSCSLSHSAALPVKSFNAQNRRNK